MGRPAKRLQARVAEYKKHGLVASKNNDKLFCNLCNEELAFERKSTIDNHLKSIAHKRHSGKYIFAYIQLTNLFKYIQWFKQL